MGKVYGGKVCVMTRPSVGAPGPETHYGLIGPWKGQPGWEGPQRSTVREAVRDLASELEDRGFVHPRTHDHCTR